MRYAKLFAAFMICVAFCGTLLAKAAVPTNPVTNAFTQHASAAPQQKARASRKSFSDRVLAKYALLKHTIRNHPLVAGTVAGATLYVAYLMKNRGKSEGIPHITSTTHHMQQKNQTSANKNNSNIAIKDRTSGNPTKKIVLDGKVFTVPSYRTRDGGHVFMYNNASAASSHPQGKQAPGLASEGNDNNGDDFGSDDTNPAIPEPLNTEPLIVEIKKLDDADVIKRKNKINALARGEVSLDDSYYEVLRDSILYGGLDEVESLVRAGVLKNKKAHMALHDAVGFSHYGYKIKEKIGLLLDYGIDRNRFNTYGHTPLMNAMRSCDSTVIQLLVCRGADVNLLSQSHNKQSALLQSVSDINTVTNFENIKALFAAYDKKGQTKIDVNVQDSSGKSALHYICQALLYWGDKSTLKDVELSKKLEELLDMILADKRTDVNLQDDGGNTVFISAVKAQAKKSRAMLLEKLYATKKIDIAIKDKYETSLLLHVAKAAAESGNIGELDRLLTYAQTECFDMSTDQGKQQYKDWINHKNERGETALVYLLCRNRIYKGKYQHLDLVVTSLLNAYADPNMKMNSLGETLLMVTAFDANDTYASNIPLFKALLAAPNIDVNARDKQGKTVLHRIVTCNVIPQKTRMELMSLLFEAPHVQVDTACKDTCDISVLHDLACGSSGPSSECIQDEDLVAMFKSLVAYGVDVNALDEQGNTPLMVACGFGKLELVQEILSIGHEQSETQKQIRMCMENVFSGKSMAIVDTVIVPFSTLTPAELDVANSKGDTALALAACYRFPEQGLPIVQALIDAGADISKKYPANSVFSKEWTLVDYAIKIKNYELLQDLFKRNSAVDVSQLKTIRSDMDFDGRYDKNIYSLLNTIIAQQEESLKQEALQARDGHNKLFFAVMEDPQSTEQQKKDAQKNIRTDLNERFTECTLLHDAARLGHVKSVSYLLGRIKANTKSSYYHDGALTPLHYAAQEGHVHVVQLFIDHEEKFKNQPYSNFTSYKEAGWLFTDQDGEQRTPLMLAAKNGHLDVVKLLVKQYDGFDGGKTVFVRATDKNNCSALLYAAQSGSPNASAIIKLLLSSNAPCDVRTLRKSETPLLCAAQVGNVDTIAALLQQRDRDYQEREFVQIIAQQSLTEENKKNLMSIAIQNRVIDAKTLKSVAEYAESYPLTHAAAAAAPGSAAADGDSEDESLLAMLTRESAKAQEQEEQRAAERANKPKGNLWDQRKLRNEKLKG